MIDLNEINRDPWPTFPVNKDDLRSLLAENARMRDALAPFAALAIYGDAHAPDTRDTDECGGICVGDLRAARAALGRET